MADTFGLQFDGLREKLEQAGGYEDIVLYAVQTGTTLANLRITGLSSEKAGIPVPEDSTIMVTLSYAAYISDDAPEAGTVEFAAARVGSGNVAILNQSGVGNTSETTQTNYVIGAGDFTITFDVAENTTNQSVEITAVQGAGTDVAYINAKAKIVCVKNGQLLPPYSGGATANSPFGVS